MRVAHHTIDYYISYFLLNWCYCFRYYIAILYYIIQLCSQFYYAGTIIVYIKPCLNLFKKKFFWQFWCGLFFVVFLSDQLC